MLFQFLMHLTYIHPTDPFSDIHIYILQVSFLKLSKACFHYKLQYNEESAFQTWLGLKQCIERMCGAICGSQKQKSIISELEHPFHSSFHIDPNKIGHWHINRLQNKSNILQFCSCTFYKNDAINNHWDINRTIKYTLSFI